MKLLLSPLKSIPKKILIILFCSGIILSLQFTKNKNESVADNVEKYYVSCLNNLKKQINSFKNLNQKKLGLQSLQQQFLSARLSYKKLAVLTDYFNVSETKLLNSPAIDKVVEDNPGIIIPPNGFQAVEQLLFSNWKESPNSGSQLNALLTDIQRSIGFLENENGRIQNFRDELVWDAIRSSIVRLALAGIAGLDSPTAQYSLPEATATIESVKELLAIFKPALNKTEQKNINDEINLLNRMQSYLSANNNFNTFDRFSFIKQFINPFYKQLVAIRISCGISIPQGQQPVNFNASSIFATDYFNISFFAPGKDYAITDERILLGKKLFFDPILSGTHTRSCSSCHNPEKAFTDGLKTPYELDEKTSLTRNTPTLWNSALQTRQFFDSRTDMLENQLDQVVHNAKEMKGSLKQSVDDLKKNPEYSRLFQKAYPGVKEPVFAYNIANAISSYIRSLIAFNSKFDLSMRDNKQLLSNAEKKGFNLFAGKAKCATCHFIPLFNGLVPPVFTETESEVIGIPETINKKSPKIDPDFGKFLFTTAVIHKYSFKTPSLRNIAVTTPYMHNGVYKTLEEVMEFYNKGGGKGLKIDPPNQTLPFDKLNLSKKEITDIIAFMKTLTDTVYVIRNYQNN